MTLYPKINLMHWQQCVIPVPERILLRLRWWPITRHGLTMKVSFSLTFEKPTDPFMGSMVKAAETAIHTYVSPEVEAVITTESPSQAANRKWVFITPGEECYRSVFRKRWVGKSIYCCQLLPCLFGKSWVS